MKGFAVVEIMLVALFMTFIGFAAHEVAVEMRTDKGPRVKEYKEGGRVWFAIEEKDKTPEQINYEKEFSGKGFNVMNEEGK